MEGLIKRFRFFHYKKGFTLVEVVFALAVFSIFALLLCVTFSVVFAQCNLVNKIDRNLDTQIKKVEQSSVNQANNETHVLKFDSVDDVSGNGTFVATDSTDDAIHLRTFAR